MKIAIGAIVALLLAGVAFLVLTSDDLSELPLVGSFFAEEEVDDLGLGSIEPDGEAPEGEADGGDEAPAGGDAPAEGDATEGGDDDAPAEGEAAEGGESDAAEGEVEAGEDDESEAETEPRVLDRDPFRPLRTTP